MIPPLQPSAVQALAVAMESALTHRELTEVFERRSVPGADESVGSKVNRLRAGFEALQARRGCANEVLAIVKEVMAPVRFAGNAQRFEDLRVSVNRVLAFAGVSLRDDGQLVSIPAAKTLSEAEQRADRLRAKLMVREVHSEVLRFCQAELVADNYFHAVFEATKSVADKIRNLTGLATDGGELVDQAFAASSGLPLLAINRYSTETERSEHKGFANLLRGMFGTFRNVTAHAPKVRWPIDEADALDLLSLASYVHRRLERATVTHGAR